MAVPLAGWIRSAGSFLAEVQEQWREWGRQRDRVKERRRRRTVKGCNR
jgi:hypothetical protein